MREQRMESDEPGNVVAAVMLGLLITVAFVAGVFVGAIGIQVTR